MFFDAFSSNIDEFLCINPTTNVFGFRYFIVHHKDWVTYSGRTDRPGELAISNYLIQMVNFIQMITLIPDCDSHCPALLNLFFSSDASICSVMAFQPMGNSNHVATPVSTDCQSNSKQNALFHCMVYDYSCANRDSVHDHLRDVPWEISLNSVRLLLLNFVSRSRL